MSYMTPHKHAHMSQSRTIAVSLRGASLSHLPPVATQFKRLSCRHQRLPADISEQRSCPFSTAEPRLQTRYSHPSAPSAVFGPHPRLSSSLGCLSLRPAPPIGLDASYVLLAFILVSTCFSLAVTKVCSPPTLGRVAPHPE